MQSSRRFRGLFINPTKANCSIYESGCMVYNCLVLSGMYELDYQEVNENNRSLPDNYDFYAFNYHHITMGWLDTRVVRKLPGLKLTFVLEVSPNNPFILCPSEDFDAYCVLDPTMNISDKRVYPFPRPLEVPARGTTYREQPVPVIGSFGFATPGKGFELVVDAVNKEFDEAIVRINIPPGTYADDSFWYLHKQNYADYLTHLCKNTAKKGIQIIATHNYMSKEELIEWSSQNTLNLFLYNRNQTGLSATTDQAISSGRPLAISTNETFRHITKYINPYPYRNLKESIIFSQPEVIKMQKEWSPENFAKKFEKVLKDSNLMDKSEEDKKVAKMIELKIKQKPSSVVGRIYSMLLKGKHSLGIPEKNSKRILDSQKHIEIKSDNQKARLLIVSHRENQCGIYQYGVNIYEALKKSSKYLFDYIECSSKEDLSKAIAKTNPDVIIYNYYPATMPWLTSIVTRQYSIPQLGIMHEVTQEKADKATRELFDCHLCPDPTLIENNPIIIKTKRLMPPYTNTKRLPDIITIGSFGFGFHDKGFERIIETVQSEFDQARIILHLPFNDIVDKKGGHALGTAERCKRLVTKPGIELTISHDFISKQKLLDFLASNTLNAFFYETQKYHGISSTIEHALAVQRPMAINKCGMFRHVLSATPSICIEDSSLREIINNDILPLVPFYNEWSEAAFIKDYEYIFDRLFQVQNKSSISDIGVNR